MALAHQLNSTATRPVSEHSLFGRVASRKEIQRRKCASDIQRFVRVKDFRNELPGAWTWQAWDGNDGKPMGLAWSCSQLRRLGSVKTTVVCHLLKPCAWLFAWLWAVPWQFVSMSLPQISNSEVQLPHVWQAPVPLELSCSESDWHGMFLGKAIEKL